MSFEFRYGRITPRGTSRKVPQVRWIHVRDDGTEQDFPCEPEGVPSICVKVNGQSSTWVDEETCTYDHGEDPAPPPKGGGWVRGVRTGGSTTWIRRRELRL